MIKFEIILSTSVIIGLILNLILFPGNTILLSLFLSLLAFLYFSLGFAIFNQIQLKHIFTKDYFKGFTSLRIVGSIGTGIALSLICIGTVFKFEHWPDSRKILIIGLVISVIVLLIVKIE